MKTTLATPASGTGLKTATKNGYLSFQILTAACHGVLNTGLTPPTPVPDWFSDLESQLATAKKHASGWVFGDAPDVTSVLPQAIIEFSLLFNIAMPKVVTAFKAAMGGDNSQLPQALNQLKAVQVVLGVIQTKIDGTNARLTQLASDLKADHDALNGSVGTIQSALGHEQDLINKLNNDIKILHQKISYENNLLALSEITAGVGLLLIVAGIGLTIATGGAGAVVLGAGVVTTVGGAVGWGVLQHEIDQNYRQITTDQAQIAADKRQIAMLSALHTSVQGALDWVNQAAAALVEVRTIWGSMADNIDSIVANIQAAQQTGDTDVLANDLTDLQESQAEWADLQASAEALLATSITVQNQTTSLPAAA